MKMAQRTERNFKKFAKRSLEMMMSEYEREETAKEKLQRKESLSNKIYSEQRKCIQPLYPLEKNLAKKSGEELENAKQELIAGLDKAAADTFGRIIAEIKQVSLNSLTLIKVDLSVEDFYNNFEDTCVELLENCQVSQEEFDQLVNKYTLVNFSRIRNLSIEMDYSRAIEQIKTNSVILKQCAIKENVVVVD